MDVARLLAESMGSDVEPHVTGEYRVGDIRHNFADISRLERVTGFRPEISVREGIRRFAEWVQTQPIPEGLLERANAELKERKLMA
jgi:dTDP-L-rhamnose 4-epimerase